MESVKLHMNNDLLDAVLGCLAGGAFGDAMGITAAGGPSPLQASGPEPMPVSDDTQLTLATCEAIISANGKILPGEIASGFAHWFGEKRITGIGSSTYKALSQLLEGHKWNEVGATGERAAGNGAAVRMAPLGFCADPWDSEGREIIREVCNITHKNDDAFAGSLAIAAAVRAAQTGRWHCGNGLLEVISNLLPDSVVRDRIERLTDLGDGSTIEEVAEQYGNTGYVAESVPLALFAAERASTEGMESVLAQIVTSGGDSDSIASLAGQVIGACVGFKNFPENLKTKVPIWPAIENTASRFAACVAATV